MMHRQGFVLVSVLALSVCLLVFVAILYFQTRAQRESHDLYEINAKALAAARGMQQLALYKFRVLPREFYVYDSYAKGTYAMAILMQSYWMDDLQSGTTAYHSPAAELAEKLKESDGGTYQLGVSRFELVSKGTKAIGVTSCGSKPGRSMRVTSGS